MKDVWNKTKQAWSKTCEFFLYIWSYIAFAINFEWVKLGKKWSIAILVFIFVALSLIVGLTAVPVKDATILGVEFGGGYNIYYDVYQKPNGMPVTSDAVASQATSMYHDCLATGHSNCIVTYLPPKNIKVIIPGVSNDSEIQSTLEKFKQEPLGLTPGFSTTLSGVLGSQDLLNSLTAGAIAFGIVWFVLILRYQFAGILGVYLCIVFLWLLMVFFNAGHNILSEASIMALVLNIGLAADSHIITFERTREELHNIPYKASDDEAMMALNKGQRHALVTILEASITTVIGMLVLFLAGEGPVSDFAFMVMISVATSFLINVIFVRFITRLFFFAGWLRTGQFFGDKGPRYDEEQRKKWYSSVKYWRPRRTVPFNFIFFWWIGAAATLGVIIAGSYYLGSQDQHPLNLDVDFTAGTALDLVLPPNGTYTADDVSGNIEDIGGHSVATAAVGPEGHVNVRFDDVLSTYAVKKIVTGLKHVYGTPVLYVESTVDPLVANQLVHNGIVAVIIAAIIVTVFVLLRFGPGFATAGLVGLASSGVFSLMCFAIGGYEIDVTFVAAVLTVFSYAINDCVVVFDRIRYDLREAEITTLKELRDVVNGALARVTIRSLLTLMTVFVCSMCLGYLGAEPLHAFSLAITFGLISVAYSTLLIVSPLWYGLRAFTMIVMKKRGHDKMSDEESDGEKASALAQNVTGIHASSSKKQTMSHEFNDEKMDQSVKSVS